jgi:hypothetical protein
VATMALGASNSESGLREEAGGVCVTSICI